MDNNQNGQVIQPEMDQMNGQFYQQPEVNNEAENKKIAKKAFSKYGIFLTLYALIASVIQVVVANLLVKAFGPEVTSESWYSFGLIILSMHVFGSLFMGLTTMHMDKANLEKHKMKFWQFICTIFMTAGLVGVGAIIGAIVQMLILAPFGASDGDTSGLINLMLDSNPFWRILTVGILAPIVEEFILRKLLVDRVVKYGEWTAILTSGVLFGLLHGNFQQLFFATFIGIFFAYIYVRTGKIWYTILLHMIVNLTTSVFTMYFISFVDFEVISEMQKLDPSSQEVVDLMMQILPGFMIYMAWVCFLGLCCLVGIILFIVNRKKFFLEKRPDAIKTKPVANAWATPGIIIFFVYSVIMIAVSIVSVIV